MNTQVLEIAKKWATDTYIDAEDREKIQKLIDDNNIAELTECFWKNLEFGTGGLRSILGLGSNRMNKYNVRKATQAVAKEILATNSNKPKVAICFDSRHYSIEFSKEVASVFAGNGIKAYLYSALKPVAMLSFATRYYGCTAGVMVTASHNPKEYNGYKVYWADGAQVTPPYDSNIISNYNNMNGFDSIKIQDFETAKADGMIEMISEECEEAYYTAILNASINPDLCREKGHELKIVYTPIHGTGLVPCVRALQDLGLTNYSVVKEQELPDGSFPTVASPNPENASALKMAVDLLKAEKADLAIGSDPDADRVGVAVAHNNEIQYLNGNQIGTILLHYILKNKKEKGELKENSYFVKTIVTNDIQHRIAKSFGVTGYDTLTGFKWICSLMKEKEENEPSANFVFGTEESFGYLNHTQARDKDGVSSVSLLCEAALSYKLQGKTLVNALEDIYVEYGYTMDSLINMGYEGKEGSEKIDRIMTDFRNSPPSELCSVKVEQLADYKSLELKSLKDDSITKISLPNSNVIGLHLEGGSKVYLRPSGTEPKIKFYLMLSTEEGTLEEKKEKLAKLTNEMTAYLKGRAEKA